MNSIERKRTIAKLVLIVSTILLVALLLAQFTGIFSPATVIDDSSSTTDLATAYKQIKEKYDQNTAKIKTANDNADKLNTSTNELKSYGDKKIPMYAIGGGISIILGLWISTVIFYIKESRDLFKK